MDAAVIGAGPAGLMAAEVLAQGGARVTVFDAMPSVGRKFLMAGRGGLNLTHGEPWRNLSRIIAKRRQSSKRRSRPSRRSACGPGARRWGSRPLSARADG